MAQAVSRLLSLVLLCALAACGGPRTGPLSYAPERGSYPAPGSAEDPWGPYIDEASRRFGVPAQWVRAVMHQESGGHEYLNGSPITSSAGAMGLMQLMPATYADLQAQYGLGGDPYDPHDNIMAGTAYIRQMYDRYGSPGFLAAYNAGPARVDDYLAGQGGLPNETVNYVAAIAPHLGGSPAVTFAPRTTPAVAYAAARPAPAGGGCTHDPDAAFDPDAPCAEAEAAAAPAASAATPEAPPVAVADAAREAGGCVADPDAAYDPGTACAGRVRAAAWQPSASAIGGGLSAPPPAGMVRMATYAVPASAPGPSARAASFAAPPVRAAARAGDAWAIQVGAFGQPGEARFATAMAQNAAPGTLAGARPVVMTIPGLGGRALYRARLAGLDRATASAACEMLRGHAMPCMLVQPGG